MDKLIKTNLEFHQTFKPERNCLNSLLTDLDVCSGKDVQEISKITGIPIGKSSGKVVPTICYLEYMGMISGTLANKKIYFIIHCFRRNCSARGSWIDGTINTFIDALHDGEKICGSRTMAIYHCNILPKYHGKISKTNLETELALHFQKTVNLAPFNGTYNTLFSSLHLVEISSNEYSLIPHNFNEECIYLYAYIYMSIGMNG